MFDSVTLWAFARGEIHGWQARLIESQIDRYPYLRKQIRLMRESRTPAADLAPASKAA
jgi:hypothetical protein